MYFNLQQHHGQNVTIFSPCLLLLRTHFQRTVPDASELFEPLENAIGDQLIPALVGQEVSDAERQILALPLRHGGLGLTDPRETTKTEYKHSTQITNKLTAKIYTQNLDLDYNPSDQQFTRHTKNRIRQKKNAKTSVMNFW